MPLSEPANRREIHHRLVDMRVYARDDALYDIEAHLVDRKAFAFKRLSAPEPVPAGQALHDLRVRLTVDEQYVVRAVEAAADVTPWAMCKEAEATLRVLLGASVVRGWSAVVKDKLRGTASCTHLMEMLIPMATTAIQGIRGLAPKDGQTATRHKAQTLLDTCYSYSRQRDVVRNLWPQHFRPAEDT